MKEPSFIKFSTHKCPPLDGEWCYVHTAIGVVLDLAMERNLAEGLMKVLHLLCLQPFIPEMEAQTQTSQIVHRFHLINEISAFANITMELLFHLGIH